MISDSLSKGYVKQCVNRLGDARSLTRWKCFIISNGERSIETTIKEGGRTVKAGQSIRLLDLVPTGKYGVYDDLHGLPNGAALSDKIKSIVDTHHGHAGRIFLERLTCDNRNFREYLDALKNLPEFQGLDNNGQFKRAAARFAVIALAGELATEYGLTGWAKGAAMQAAAQSFKLWQSTRSRGNTEQQQILVQLSHFIERYEDSRFSRIDGSDSIQIRDKAGYREDRDGVRFYLFNSPGMQDALKSFDFKRSLDVLVDAGSLAFGTSLLKYRSQLICAHPRNENIFLGIAMKRSNWSTESRHKCGYGSAWDIRSGLLLLNTTTDYANAMNVRGAESD